MNRPVNGAGVGCTAVKGDMWVQSLRSTFLDSNWIQKAVFEMRMAMRRMHHLGERNMPSLEAGVHEG
jgi:hypothetical protein